MSSFKEWVEAMFGHSPNHVDDEARVVLDRAELDQAGRLSKLTGKRRDEVLAEAYRRADKVINGRHPQ